MGTARGGSVAWAAFLRGVMPTNLKMPALKAAVEAAGGARVATVLSSGNVVFHAADEDDGVLGARLEAVLAKQVGKVFPTVVWRVDALEGLMKADPFSRFRVAPGAKRVVSFLRAAPKPKPTLPAGRDGAVLHGVDGRLAFTSYVPSPKGPVFMALIAEAFGEGVTTRTLDTIAKVVAKSRAS